MHTEDVPQGWAEFRRAGIRARRHMASGTQESDEEA